MPQPDTQTCQLIYYNIAPLFLQLLSVTWWKQAKYRRIFCLQVGKIIKKVDLKVSMFHRSTETTTEENTDAAAERRQNLKQARDLRYVYEQQVSRANELFLEVCAVRLQLEERERTIAE